ncbi:MAG: hypothetical protein ACRD2Y_06470 [Terriglobales bacterium]
MEKINWSRVIRGGLLWAATYSVLGAAAMGLFLEREFLRELEALGRPLQLTNTLLVSLLIFGVVFTVLWGISAIWLYAAIRPRYGPGPKTATIAALAIWFLSILASVSHMSAFGLTMDIPTELVLILAATLVGAWQYKE